MAGARGRRGQRPCRGRSPTSSPRHLVRAGPGRPDRPGGRPVNPDPARETHRRPEPPPDRPTRREAASRWNRQFIVTIALLVGFAALVVAMVAMADGDEKIWQRRVYVFGAVEAIVFTAIGWLFGREVHRATAESAREDADTAKKDADAARSEALQEAVRSAEIEGKVKAVRAAARSSGPAPTPSPGT